MSSSSIENESDEWIKAPVTSWYHASRADRHHKFIMGLSSFSTPASYRHTHMNVYTFRGTLQAVGILISTSSSKKTHFAQSAFRKREREMLYVRRGYISRVALSSVITRRRTTPEINPNEETGRQLLCGVYVCYYSSTICTCAKRSSQETNDATMHAAAAAASHRALAHEFVANECLCIYTLQRGDRHTSITPCACLKVYTYTHRITHCARCLCLCMA
ncbi:unnamed protein product [Trichogramma brassicae]|uniref:Uncharacterized protein n=1 Tax=Trichogramma brassicae TaxID=86971 RepID=A0A6H5IRB5_9HYME|nr:unnamed protein product [Trichogramma brassicae]